MNEGMTVLASFKSFGATLHAWTKVSLDYNFVKTRLTLDIVGVISVLAVVRW